MKSHEPDTSFKGFVKTTTAMTVGSVVRIAGSLITGSPDMTVKSWANTEKKSVTKAGTAARAGLAALWTVALLHNTAKNDAVDEIIDAAALAATSTGLIVSRANALRGAAENQNSHTQSHQTELLDPTSANLNPDQHIVVHRTVE